MSVSDAIVGCYQDRVGGAWGLYDLVDVVRDATGRMVLDGTVTRKMRELRGKGLIGYQVIDRNAGAYRWVEVR